MARVAICGVARTPIGKFRGSLSGLSAVELGIRSVKELLNRCDIEPSSGVMMRCYLVRFYRQEQVKHLLAKLHWVFLPNILLLQLSTKCGSSLKAVMMAANSIKSLNTRSSLVAWKA